MNIRMILSFELMSFFSFHRRKEFAKKDYPSGAKNIAKGPDDRILRTLSSLAFWESSL